MKYSTKKSPSQPQIVTLAGLAKMTAEVLTPEFAALVLSVNPNSIRVSASTEEGRNALGFPVVRVGTRTLIPRIPFLRYLGWEGEINGATEVVA